MENFLKRAGLRSFEFEPLGGDGSSRSFWRVKTPKESFILILPQEGEFGLKEARSYVLIGRFLEEKGLPVPRIYAYEEEKGFILAEDLGDQRLEDISPEKRYPLYRQALEILASFRGLFKDFPREAALETLFYDSRLMWKREACYFLEEFLSEYLGPSELHQAEDLLFCLWERLKHWARPQAFLHRDFQSRNLMVKGERLYLIDFQAARLGPSAYDLASLLIDPYVALPEKERKRLQKEFEALVSLEPEEFEALALFRNFQILGAFSKLTKAGKVWFRAYIPQAVRTLKELLALFPPEGAALAAYLPSF